MNVKEYISSGILEMYVMGLLSEDENMLVEENAQTYPEVKEEIDRIEETLVSYAGKDVPTPSEKIRQNILKEIEKNPAKTKQPVTRIISQSVYKTKYLAAASFALFLLSGLINLILWLNLQETKSEVNRLTTENLKIAEENTSVQKTLAAASDKLKMLQNPDFKVVKLKGLDKSPGSMAVVFWDEKTKDVYLQPMEMPAPPEGKQYQLWAIAGGKPVDAGVMKPDTTGGMHKMKNIAGAEAFAITLEPMGGSAGPTMDQMYVMGAL